VDSKTRHALKQDKFVLATSSSISWLEEHRSTLLRIGLPAVIAVILVISGAVYCTQQNEKADTQLGAAMTIYTGQLVPPGQPALPGLYNSASDRAKAALKGFSDVASHFSWLPQGRKALYFKALAEVDLNQTGSAESDLKSVAKHGGDLGNLAHVALANLYHATQRDAQAADELNAVISKPSGTVSALTAQLYLGDLYQHSDPSKSKTIYAKVKDADKEGPLGKAAEDRIASLK
jgi:predicted negative regulator of RcsB-dependent stress response